VGGRGAGAAAGCPPRATAPGSRESAGSDTAAARAQAAARSATARQSTSSQAGRRTRRRASRAATTAWSSRPKAALPRVRGEPAQAPPATAKAQAPSPSAPARREAAASVATSRTPRTRGAARRPASAPAGGSRAPRAGGSGRGTAGRRSFRCTAERGAGAGPPGGREAHSWKEQGVLAAGRLHTCEPLEALREPTRGLRHPDYALASASVPLRYAGTAPGCMDHRFCFYDLPCEPLEPCGSWPPRRPLLRGPPGDARLAAWEAALPGLQAGVCGALAEGRTDRAWELLSGAAEAHLADPAADYGGVPRAQVPPPRAGPPAPRRQPLLESVLVRRLLRARRRWEAARADLADSGALRRLARCLRGLGRRYPELLDLPALADGLGPRLLELAELRRLADGRLRLERWAARLAQSEGRATAWVRQRPARPDFARDPDAPVHPQRRLERKLAAWLAFWSPGRLASLRDLEPFLGDLPVSRPAACDLGFRGPELRARLRRKASAAPGPDGWAATQLLLMPDAWFELLAAVWTSVLGGAPLPEAWRHTRLVFLPKPQGGLRPISIADSAVLDLRLPAAAEGILVAIVREAQRVPEAHGRLNAKLALEGSPRHDNLRFLGVQTGCRPSHPSCQSGTAQEAEAGNPHDRASGCWLLL